MICSIFVGACFGLSLYGSAASLSNNGSSITQVWFQLGISFYGLLLALLIFLIICYPSSFACCPSNTKFNLTQPKYQIGAEDIMGYGEPTIIQTLAMAWILLYLHWIVGGCSYSCI